MAISNLRRFVEQSRRLRRKLAELGIRPPERENCETLEQECQRLKATLRWCFDLTRI